MFSCVPEEVEELDHLFACVACELDDFEGSIEGARSTQGIVEDCRTVRIFQGLQRKVANGRAGWR